MNQQTNKPQMTENQNFLRMIDSRLSGLRASHAAESEVQRVEGARTDILSRMDEAEQAQYIKITTVQLTDKERKAQADAERIAMEANRDKPSI